MPSLRHKIGQMLIMGFSGLTVDDNSPVAKWLQTDGLGGVLLFNFDLMTKRYGKNLNDKEQIKRLNEQLNHYSKQENNLPLFIALDYEGGAVDRLATIDGCMKTLKACEQASLSNDALYAESEKMALTCKELGFNLNFAPVIDLNLNQEQGIIGKLGRSYSNDPAQVIRAASQFVKAFNHHNIVCAYKHFPGHGSAVGDTHEGFVDVSGYYQNSELQPYESLLKQDAAAMVMTAHVINRHLDADGLPATLSFPILTGLLRQQMGFNGVIVSDDLQMQAISHHYAIDEALRMTIHAGADMLIFANQLGQISATEVIDRIEQLTRAGEIKVSRIDESYHRIMRLKERLTIATL
ncbi:glycoside hydrolase family 3 protein [Legionella oakridgensis]|uniref:beta-N-acetylhexosaminidase n=2 Tax=Legionella oakridgensis TaxID=29423 RepID=W0BG86_9GAMM|nr:glycoside hydrolase family 3 N-terminal domain-containing protein [Legionella oakridgensis]AHE67449.1 beta-glucosidase-related glycosidase [Legionella oakridgensis ATCC 33761 = DSM 21215]ETO92978.1 beta-glucosidase-related glycosidase [Legionella oakridgensis RV-2-2007]KTD43506.1 glycosyl hydrolase [Legionella oakridgensis]STY20498.1 beta-N-acetylhexosaminidase [Legionella longbeachae]